MLVKTILLLLLLSVEAVVASQCWQGAIFSETVVSPAVESSGILRIPGVSSMPQCVAACCDLPGYDLAWLFDGRCYVLSCQQRENCQPHQRPGARSFLAFLRRASPPTLVLQSLVRGDPYGGRWRPLSRPSEAPGDLEALKDLALFEGPQQHSPDPESLDVEYSEGGQGERGGGGPDVVDPTSMKERGDFNRSEADAGEERRPTEDGAAQMRAASWWNIMRGDEDRTSRPTDPESADKTVKTENSSVLRSTADSTHQHHIRTIAPTQTTPHWPSSTTTQPDEIPPAAGSLKTSSEKLTVTLDATVSPGPTTDMKTMPHSAATGPSTASLHPLGKIMTFDPTTTSPLSADPPAATLSAPSVAETALQLRSEVRSEVRGSNRGPLAVVGPDQELFLPLSSLLLDGRGSTDDHGILSYHWVAISGPPGLKLEDTDQAVAMATGFRAGRYTFRLTVSDQEGATDSDLLTVRVREATRLPPVAHASGSHTLTLPNNSLVLRGSVTDGDQTAVQYLWLRDRQSPAAGDVLYGSETQAALCLANLVEGTYLFQLRVTDAQGRSSTAAATVEVRPEPGGGEEVELEMLVSVSQVSLSQRDTVVRQLAALLHVLDSDVQVRALQGHSRLSTVLRFSVRGPEGPLSGSRLVSLLRNQLLREKNDYLLFRVLRVDTVLCLLRCSGRGQCDPVTKLCSCDPFWTENLIRRYLGDGESNCEWRMLYVIVSSFLLVFLILSVSWTCICCCRRGRQIKGRKKNKYTILDNMDDQERVELRPKFSIKHRSTEHNSSLMMSESEPDSDQDTVFSRERPVRSRNRLGAQGCRNGNMLG